MWFSMSPMAKNKRDVDAEVKRDHIEAVACQCFLAEGYEATSMAAIAKAAGVAPNTLYWYFASKDDLLVAILDRLVQGAVAQLPARQAEPMADQVLWLLAEFQRANKLIATVHARLDQSPMVREWHDRFHTMLDQMLIDQLVAKGLSPAKAAVMATVGTYVVEGLLSHPHGPQQVKTVVHWLTGGGKL
jgi:TetR/AcrR family transcriptional regulator, regulator of autoinduction and epiphytic fitness